MNDFLDGPTTVDRLEPQPISVGEYVASRLDADPAVRLEAFVRGVRTPEISRRDLIGLGVDLVSTGDDQVARRTISASRALGNDRLAILIQSAFHDDTYVQSAGAHQLAHEISPSRAKLQALYAFRRTTKPRHHVVTTNAIDRTIDRLRASGQSIGRTLADRALAKLTRHGRFDV